ncbi:MAG: hypothetical protein JWN03_7423 [Nocardia sp.]|uniref:hypothetical protein n=1 Tax=Nocardia sp. TaxID=1821 RepID=UPI00260DEAA0|nr:hypothetical protein [Nocardia sp.]MCU1647148.1 hypothetical protein [Nocardia sp.]
MIRIALHLPFGIALHLQVHRGFDPADIVVAAWSDAWREPPYDDEEAPDADGDGDGDCP